MINRIVNFISNLFHQLKHPADDIVGCVSGLFGGVLYIHFAGVTWQNAFENIGKLCWVGFVAFFTGGMGILGKHVVQKYILKKKKQ